MKTKHILKTLIIVLLFTASCKNTKKIPANNIPSTFAFYNIENLFDTINDPLIEDEEFLPTSEKQWNTKKYRDKLTKLSSVISQLGDSDGPEFLGLCEVENKQVLIDLTTSTTLKKYNYKIIHENSPDARGIDVAFIYKPTFFEVINYKYFRINFEEEEYKSYKTRDFLLVSGLYKKDTLYFIINHWPSRRGGQEKSEPRRTFVASKVRNVIDSLKLDQKNLIVTGDFNDMPTNNSIINYLKSGNDPTFATNNLYNLLHEPYLNGKGSYNYNNEWNMLDQLIVSKKINQKYIINNSAQVFSPEWLKQHGGKYEGYPDRTYAGKKYLGGYSDHFPVYLNIK